MMSGTKILFDFDVLKFEGISLQEVKLWEAAYPDVDVVDVILHKIPAWLASNPHKAYKYRQWKRFINGWLSRQQERYDQFKQ